MSFNLGKAVSYMRYEKYMYFSLDLTVIDALASVMVEHTDSLLNIGTYL